MKLIGVYLSPYVRRVAAALISRGLPYEHQPVNGYKEYEAASRYNPVGKVPSLVLDDGEILIDSSAILDYLNELVPSAPLIPAGSSARRATLKLAAIGYGVAEQAISLYGRGRTAPETDTKRWRAQIHGGLRALDERRAKAGRCRQSRSTRPRSLRSLPSNSSPCCILISSYFPPFLPSPRLPPNSATPRPSRRRGRLAKRARRTA